MTSKFESNFKVTQFQKIKDKRGDLIVFLKESELDTAKRKFGQIYFVTFKGVGIVRGNHYHKKWHEWFGIVSGRVRVILADVRTKERKEFIISANKDKYIRIETGPYIAHAFKSITKSASLLSYADGEWSKDDTHNYKLL